MSKCCWKNGVDRVGQHKITTNFPLVKNTVSVKCNTTREVWITACWPRGSHSHLPVLEVTACWPGGGHSHLPVLEQGKREVKSQCRS